MTLKTFLQFCTINAIEVAKHANWRTFGSMTKEEIYNKILFYVPRVYCADDFNISIQVHNSNYCASDKGYRELGTEWVDAEWGFPTMPISADKYNADDKYIYNEEYNIIGTQEMVTSTVGRCSVELLQGLLDEHGGIDWDKTFSHAIETTTGALDRK